MGQLFVSRAELQAAEVIKANLRICVDDLQKRLLDTVPKHNHNQCMDELLAAKSLLVNLRREASLHLEEIKVVVEDMKQLELDDEIDFVTDVNWAEGYGIVRSQAISFAVPAEGLATNRSGLLTPFMMQVFH